MTADDLDGTAQDKRNHVEALLQRATDAARVARDVAMRYELTEPAERIAWALDFLASATAEVQGRR